MIIFCDETPPGRGELKNTQPEVCYAKIELWPPRTFYLAKCGLTLLALLTLLMARNEFCSRAP